MSEGKLKKLLEGGVVVGDGAIGSMLYQQGFFVNSCFEELNITNPALIRGLHSDYISAGSDFIETNTYGGDRKKLAAFGLADKVRDINIAGAQIACQAAAGRVLVAGSVGPATGGFDDISAIKAVELEEIYAEQIAALYEGGVDFFILETFIYPEDLLIAAKAAAKVCGLEIIASLRPQPQQTQADTEILIEGFKRVAACENVSVIGLNCGAGPAVMLRYLEAVRNLTDKPLCIQPNVGLPQTVDGRTLYMCTPEYVAEYAKRFYEKGADIIGGCCGTGPEHIRRISKAVKSVNRADRTVQTISAAVSNSPANVAEPAVPFAARSALAKKIASGEPVRMIEITPPRSINLDETIEKVRLCARYGIDAVNIPDGPRASCRQSALASAVKCGQIPGIETVLHVCSRDRNIIALQSDMLGAQSLGINNMLFITGDPPKLGDYPDAAGVFDIDAIGLTRMADMLNRGFDVSGRAIPQPTAITIGVGVNPGANDIEREMKRFRMKAAAGAEYCITQPAFDTEVFEKFIEMSADCHIPVIAGIWPFVSYKNAEFMANEVPGVVVPQKLLKQMAAAADKKQTIRTGIEIARHSMEAIKDKVAGFAVSAPFGNVRIALCVFGEISPDEL